MDDKTNAVLSYLANDLKRAIDVQYAQDCCIAATRIALDILEYFEIPAREEVTQVLIYNSAYREYVEKHQRFPEKKELVNDVYNIGLGFPNPTVRPTKGKGFCGHLVAYLDEGYLVDLSITQAHRPSHKIYLKPLVAKVVPDFLKDGGQAFSYPQKDTGDLILDYILIKNDDYKSAVDWTSERRKPISMMAILAIEEYLGKGVQDESQMHLQGEGGQEELSSL